MYMLMPALPYRALGGGCMSVFLQTCPTLYLRYDWKFVAANLIRLSYATNSYRNLAADTNVCNG